MSTSSLLQTLARNAKQADEAIAALSSQLRTLETIARERGVGSSNESQEAAKLKAENAALRAEIEQAKKDLEAAERQNGKVIVSLPATSSSAAATSAPAAAAAPADGNKHKAKGKAAAAAAAAAASATAAAATAPAAAPADAKGKQKKEKEEKPAASSAPEPAEGPEPQIFQLDFRVGKIVSAKKHPDADSLYVEEVDLNEGKLRTVVSGLVKHVPLEAMQNRLAVLLCNLKPAKMRGVTSEAMVMCASSEAKVEILDPPAGSAPGDLIVFEGHAGKPDEQLNPKKKVWETLQPFLKTDDNRVATFKGIPFTVAGKGAVTAPSLTQTPIK